MKSLCDREVAWSASDRQGSNFGSCVWRAVSPHSSHHPQEILLSQFSLYVHKIGLKPYSVHIIFAWMKSETLPRCWPSAGPVLGLRIGLHAVNTILWLHVGLMLAQRPRRWPNIKPPRIKRLSFNGQGSRHLSVHPWSPNLWLRSLYLIQRPRSPARLYCTRYRITKPQSALQVPRSLPSQHVATNAGLMLGQRRKRWPNIKPALVDLCMKKRLRLLPAR